MVSWLMLPRASAGNRDTAKLSVASELLIASHQMDDFHPTYSINTKWRKFKKKSWKVSAVIAQLDELHPCSHVFAAMQETCMHVTIAQKMVCASCPALFLRS